MKSAGKIRRIMSLVFALIMVMGLFTTKTRAESTWEDGRTTGTLTITKTSQDGETTLAGAQYTIYKVADISQDNTGGMKYTPLTDVEITSSTTASSFDGVDLSGLTSYESNVSESDGLMTFGSVELGVYLVKETTTPAGVIASNNFLISIPLSQTINNVQTWVYDVKAAPKNSVTDSSITKAVDGSIIVPDDEGNQTVNIGDSLTYTLTVTLPSDFYAEDDGTIYTQFDIIDKASSALTVDTDSIAVTVGEGTALEEGADYKLDTSTTSGQFTISLVKEEDGNYSPYSELFTPSATVTVTYTAKVNENATAGEEITNKASIIYDYEGSDGPGEITPPTIEPEPILYTYSHALIKVDEGDVLLNGADFIVQNSVGKYLTYVNNAWGTTDNSNEAYVFTSGTAGPFVDGGYRGYIELVGLAYGDYTLTEVKAPDGYSLLGKSVPVKVDVSTTAVQQNSNHTSQTGNYSTKIVNVTGFTLPTTGGMGILIFIIGGAFLIGAASFLFVKTRRNDSGNVAS